MFRNRLKLDILEQLKFQLNPHFNLVQFYTVKLSMPSSMHLGPFLCQCKIRHPVFFQQADVNVSKLSNTKATSSGGLKWFVSARAHSRSVSSVLTLARALKKGQATLVLSLGHDILISCCTSGWKIHSLCAKTSCPTIFCVTLKVPFKNEKFVKV